MRNKADLIMKGGGGGERNKIKQKKTVGRF